MSIIHPRSAKRARTAFIDAGASHVVVTSYIFDGPKLNLDKLNALVDAVGKEHVVLDLSCRSLNGEYYVVTDRWQTFTDLKVTEDVLNDLSKYCDEFLIHGVDVEGMKQGIDDKLLTILGNIDGIKITYAGGVRNMSDIDRIEQLGRGRVDFTIGSIEEIKEVSGIGEGLYSKIEDSITVN